MKNFLYYSTRLGSSVLLLFVIFIGTINVTHADVICSDHFSDLNDYSQFLKNNGSVFQERATQFTPASDCTVSSVTLRISENFTSNAHVYIYTDLAGVYNAQLEDCGAIVGMTGSMSTINTPCAGTTVLTGGTPYWIVVNGTNSGGGGSYVGWEVSNDTGPSWTSLNGVPWGGDYGSNTNMVQVYGLSTPPPASGFAALIDMATSSYESVTGISMTDVTTWTSDNLLKLFLGSGIATLYLLRFWIVAFMIFAAIVYFSFRALGFFKY